MSAFVLLALPLTLNLLACSDKDADEDTDGDGLTDTEEAELGTDPENADSDADGLQDGQEVELGTDPLLLDTDEDSYQDGWEVAEGTDPTDGSSRIYTGYWPYNPDKDSYETPDWDDYQGAKEEALPRTVLLDQYGDEVDLYDFADQDQYIALDVSAEWCPPCQGMAEWLAGGDDDYGWGDYWPDIKEAVEDGRLRWVTVMVEDTSGGTPDVDDAADWADDYPEPNTPVLVDQEDNFIKLVDAFPSIFLFDSDWTLIQGPGAANHYKPMDDMQGMFED